MKDFAPGWQVRCTKCGFVRDAGQEGHIRLGGWSWKRYVLDRCPQCRWVWFQAFERKADDRENKAV